jgi:hypothetical protein
MVKEFEILKDVDNDRYVFLHIDKSKSKYADGICGINFHQDVTEIVWSYAAEPNVYLTEIWRRITLNYPNVERSFLIEKAIDLYIDAFIIQPLKLLYENK